MKYFFWVLGGIFFLIWGAIAILRPEALYDYSRKRMERAGIPWILGPWMASRRFQVEMRLWGAMALLIGAFALWLLWCELSKACNLS